MLKTSSLSSTLNEKHMYDSSPKVKHRGDLKKNHVHVHIIIISMHILVCQELPGYIRFYKELNGVASRHENPPVHVSNLCYCYVIHDRHKLHRTPKIPWNPNVLLENFLYILIDLGPSGRYYQNEDGLTSNIHALQAWEQYGKKCQQKKKINNRHNWQPTRTPHKRRLKYATDDVDTVGSTSAVTMGASLARPRHVRMQHVGNPQREILGSQEFSLSTASSTTIGPNLEAACGYTMSKSMPALPSLPACIVDMKKLRTRVSDPSKGWSKDSDAKSVGKSLATLAAWRPACRERQSQTSTIRP